MKKLWAAGCRLSSFVLLAFCGLASARTSNLAPVPDVHSSDLASKLPWETQWTDAEVAIQRTNGAQLVQNITGALQSNASSFTIPPGTYRTSQAIVISDTTNFTLNGQGAELIAEDLTLNINLLSNTNFTMVGPTILDADPFGFTQGIIIDTDNQSTISIQMMPGYAAPTDTGNRIMFYDPEGNLFPMYQVTLETITNTSMEDVYDITLGDGFWDMFVEARQNATQSGNLVSFEIAEINGGVNTNGNDGISFRDVSVYANALIFGVGETGPVVLDEIHGIRRPGTSRLNAGGHVAFSIMGGSFHMSNSEVSYHYDDLSDIQSSLSYAFSQVSPTSVYAGFRSVPLIGTTLAFYDVATLEDNGAANITSIEAVNDQDVINSFQEGLTSLNLLDWDVVPVLIELDSAVNMTNSYALIDALQSRPSSMIFENCYFHDGLAAGIGAKGANYVLIRNNTVARAGYTGASVGFDPYWWEGGVPNNVLIQDNYVKDVPYSQDKLGGQAVSTYVDSAASLLMLGTATPMHNITIQGNTIVNPKIAGIGAVFAAGVRVLNNTVINPVAGISDTSGQYDVPFADPAAIYLDCVSGSITVTENNFQSVNSLLVGEAIMFGSNSAAPASLNICHNSIVETDGSMQALANSPWAKAYYNSPQILDSVTFGDISYPATGDRLNQTFTLPYSVQPGSATFNFTGTRVQWLSCTGPSYGSAVVQLDGVNVSAVDASVTHITLQNIDPNLGFCNQVLYDSGPLNFGNHSLQVIVQGQSGSQSESNSTSIAVLGFSYISGEDQCDSSPTTVSSIASFETVSASFGPAPAPLLAPASFMSPQTQLPSLWYLQPSSAIYSPHPASAPLLSSPANLMSRKSGSSSAPSPSPMKQYFLTAAVSGKK